MSRIFVQMLRILPLIVMAAGVGRVGFGADIFEPWKPGFSDLEFYVGAQEGGHCQGQVLGGLGFGTGGSLGVSLSTRENEPVRFGLFLAGTWKVADAADLSAWVESGLAAGAFDVELAHTDWTAGLQLVRWRDGVTPYGSMTVAGEEGEELRVHPLFGLMFPLGKVELHVELSSDEPDRGPWPVHLALGPNVHMAPWLEILPEISVVRDGGGATQWALTVGVIVDPGHWVR